MVSILARMVTCCSICFVKLLRLLVSSMNTDIRISVMDTATDAEKMCIRDSLYSSRLGIIIQILYQNNVLQADHLVVIVSQSL